MNSKEIQDKLNSLKIELTRNIKHDDWRAIYLICECMVNLIDIIQNDIVGTKIESIESFDVKDVLKSLVELSREENKILVIEDKDKE